MLIKPPHPIPASEITPKEHWLRRRELMAGAAAGLGLAVLGGLGGLLTPGQAAAEEKIPGLVPSPLSTGETPTSRKDVTGYNNFYELGTEKDDPARYAGLLKPRPWTVRVDGACAAPGEIGIEDILTGFPQEERIYRLRCVEAWAMVIPWVGFPLGDLLKRFQPTAQAKFVAFETLEDPKQLPGQNGAPLRLVVPWKYGFKSIKSIVRISFVESQPLATWNQMQPEEYGFYANVNPAVDHPRWSQKSHRIIGAGLFTPKQKTLPFNGYADQVASLYEGMDLKRFF